MNHEFFWDVGKHGKDGKKGKSWKFEKKDIILAQSEDRFFRQKNIMTKVLKGIRLKFFGYGNTRAKIVENGVTGNVEGKF
jgi:hypothetical protein